VGADSGRPLGRGAGEGGWRRGPPVPSHGASRRGRARGGRRGALVEAAPAAALLWALMLRQVNRFSGRQENEDLPQVQPVVQLGELALLGAPAEAVEGAQGDVFFIGGAAGRRAEVLAGPTDPSAEVALPQLLGRGRVTGLELVDPVCDRRVGGHADVLAEGVWSKGRWIVIAPPRPCKEHAPREWTGPG